jgi:hypothetical protein
VLASEATPDQVIAWTADQASYESWFYYKKGRAYTFQGGQDGHQDRLERCGSQEVAAKGSKQRGGGRWADPDRLPHQVRIGPSSTSSFRLPSSDEHPGTAMSDPLGGAIVAVLGYGNQGEAQALNLRDSGVAVVVGARAGGASEARARSAGFRSLPLADAARAANVCAVLLPDEVTPALWTEIAPALRHDAGIVFAHGYNLLYSDLMFPAAANVVLVSPTGPGRVLRAVFERGEGLPAYLRCPS